MKYRGFLPPLLGQSVDNRKMAPDNKINARIAHNPSSYDTTVTSLEIKASDTLMRQAAKYPSEGNSRSPIAEFSRWEKAKVQTYLKYGITEQPEEYSWFTGISDAIGGFFRREEVSDFTEGFVEGDFADSSSYATMVGQMVSGSVPGYDQVADARDLASAVDPVRRGEDGAWLNFGLSVIGSIPILGALKPPIKRLLGKVDDVVDVAADASKGANKATDGARTGGVRSLREGLQEVRWHTLDAKRISVEDVKHPKFTESWKRLGMDPATGGRVNHREVAAGLRIEDSLGRKIFRSEHAGADFVDKELGPISLKGPILPEWDIQGFARSAVADIKTNTAADVVVIDIGGLNTDTQSYIRSYIQENAETTLSKQVFFH